MKITQRSTDPDVGKKLERQGAHPVLAKIYAARGISDMSDLDHSLKGLLHRDGLKGIGPAAAAIVDAMVAGKKMLIIGDYDCDGATATAVGIRGIRSLIDAGELKCVIDYLVPDRFKYGYGLTPGIVEAAQSHPRIGKPDLIITVDNGISSISGIEAAKAADIPVIVTDHHLPGDTIPDTLIVNPNQPGCEFGSKNLAGCGVMFYVLTAIRAEMKARNLFRKPEPNLAALLDIVALGTVADVVKLDRNNRILVNDGLVRLREGQGCPGIRALFTAAGRDFTKATSTDFGFVAGPRLNAAGRLDDMSIGIECLLTNDETVAFNIAQKLDAFNRERRKIEEEMRDKAMVELDSIDVSTRHSVAIFDPSWHQGVIGIVASRIKERFNRPTIVFAPGNDGEIKGSGRSIQGLHMRDCLDLVSKRHPDLILKFGGHAMAAGLTIRGKDFLRFQEAFEQASSQFLTEDDLAHVTVTDGPISLSYLTPDFVRKINESIWGQGFPAPMFSDEFSVSEQRLMKDRHLKMKITDADGMEMVAIQFNNTNFLNESKPVKMAFRTSLNEFQGRIKVDVIVESVSDQAAELQLESLQSTQRQSELPI